MEPHAALAVALDLLDVAVIGAVHRLALLTQRVEGPDHVLRGYRRAVVETRLLAQRVQHRFAVRGQIGAFGDEAVFAAGLVLGRQHQRVEGLAHAGRRDALDDIRVEAVEGADRGEPHRAAFRRARVGVVEMLEVGTVFEIAEQRQTVARRRARRSPPRPSNRRADEKSQPDSETEWPAHNRPTHHASCHEYDFMPPTTAAPLGACAGLRQPRTRPSDATVSGAPRQSLATPPAPSTTGSIALKS